MTRSSICFGLVLALTGVLSLPARAEQRPKEVTIKKVWVGFPVGRVDDDGFPTGDEGGVFKSGFWTPVYVKLEVGLNPIVPKQYAVVVQSADVDDVNNRYVVPLTAHTAQEKFPVLAYTKPGSSFGDITVSVQEYAQAEGEKPAQLGRTIDTFNSEGSFHSLSVGSTLYLAVGSQLSELQDSLRAPGGGNSQNIKLASIPNVKLMPTQWFAYAPVDLLIVSTSNEAFIKELVNEAESPPNRWSALVEWVRRGGHLVISTHQKRDRVAALDDKAGLLPMTLTGEEEPLPEPADALAGGVHTLSWKDHGTLHLQRIEKGQPQPIYVAKLKLKPFPRESEWLVPRGPKDGPAVIVRGTYGLGQVTLVTLDLEHLPFKEGDKAAESAFWKNFREDLGAERSAGNQNDQFVVSGPAWGTVNNDLATKLQQNLEYFEDIPVIGFGWVALFILLYILVVGPLDYFFLKKVVKRLELTWITFPAVVILISVGAYFVAYWIKGDKLKMNKVDVVDIDLQTEQVYGNTWFTLFSPRIEHYTIGIEPADPHWAPGGAKDFAPVVSWMDRPETNIYGSGRSRGQSLFRRAYDYEADAAGLRGVPIQVWSMKSFTASWEAPTRGRLVSHTLHHPADNPTWIEGTVTSHLPVELDDVTVFYRQQCYALGKLPRETEVRVGDVKLKNRNLESWFSALNPGYNASPFGQRRGAAEGREPAESIVRSLAFYEASPQVGRANLRNTSLRYLDQTWRLRHLQDEVILYGRVPEQQGDAQTVAQDPASPSRLWLRDLPQGGRPWPGLSGTLRQETFVRIYIPVAPVPEEAGPK
jgi:hypothetical protein